LRRAVACRSRVGRSGPFGLKALLQQLHDPVKRGPGGVAGLVDELDGEHRVRAWADAVRVAR